MAKFLICDDSCFMRMVLKKVLLTHGHEVVGEAENGKEAIELFRKHRPDIITMDITMPELDGIGAVAIIHAEDPLTRIIMVTAIGQQAVIMEALKAGASDFIVKPFDGQQVLRTINKMLNT